MKKNNFFYFFYVDLSEKEKKAHKYDVLVSTFLLKNVGFL